MHHLDGFEEARTVFQGVIAEHELVMEAYDWLARTQRAGGDAGGAHAAGAAADDEEVEIKSLLVGQRPIVRQGAMARRAAG